MVDEKQVWEFVGWILIALIMSAFAVILFAGVEKLVGKIL